LLSYLIGNPRIDWLSFRFNRFVCVADFNPVEPNSEVNGHHRDQAKSRPKMFRRQI
jgi:hypothetical protein